MRAPRHILITGASSGLGAALAREYGGTDRRVSLFGRDAARLEAVAAGARADGAEVAIYAVDVTDAAAMADAVRAADAVRPLDLVIANAGISGGGGDGFEPGAQAQRITAANVTGILNTLGPAIDCMRPRRRGQLALVSSLAGFAGWPGAPAYSASKAWARIYGEALRGALPREGIDVAVVCPGFVRTPLTAGNPFPMPLLMDADAAARRIVRGLAAGRGRIAFPWPVYALSAFTGLVPYPLRLALLRRMPGKPTSGQ